MSLCTQAQTLDLNVTGRKVLNSKHEQCVWQRLVLNRGPHSALSA